MPVGEFHILPTKTTPEIFLSPEGIIKIKGRGMSVRKADVSEVLRAWIDDYLNKPAEITYVSIAFEYLNSNSVAKLLLFLRRISQVSMRGRKLVVYWYYEEEDDDIKERGEFISLNLNIHFEFIRIKNLSV